MKIFLFALGFVCCLSSCYKTIDSTDESCSSACTIVEGRVTTLHQQPVAGVDIEITSKQSGRYSGVTRKIARVTSGPDGHYRLKFALNSRESGADATAEVHLIYSYDESKYTPVSAATKDVMLSSPQSGLLFSNPEITVSRSIYLPLKARANLRLVGFQMGNNNSFTVTPAFVTGVYNSYLHGAISFASTSATNEFVADVAGDDTTRFKIEKWKNGNRTLTDTAVFTPIASPVTVTIAY